jgi:hypothetical protein
MKLDNKTKAKVGVLQNELSSLKKESGTSRGREI